MADPELSLFSYEILGLVGREGAGPHDLLRHGAARPDARLGRREPVLHRAQAAREARLPDARKEPGKTRERTVYTLTERGSTRCASTRERPSRSRRSRASRCCAC